MHVAPDASFEHHSKPELISLWTTTSGVRATEKTEVYGCQPQTKQYTLSIQKKFQFKLDERFGEFNMGNIK